MTVMKGTAKPPQGSGHPARVNDHAERHDADRQEEFGKHLCDDTR